MRPRLSRDGVYNGIIFALAVGYALFNIYAMAVRPIGSWIHLPVNLMCSSVLALLVFCHKRRAAWAAALAVAVGALSVISCMYMALNYRALIWRPANLLPADLICAVFAVVATLVVTKMTSGWALPIVAMTFLAYAFFGRYLPGIFGHSGYSFQRIMYSLYGETGIFGQPLSTASSFVFLFCLFGAFLEVFSGGQVFIDLATGIAGKYRGGPAKVAVLASAFFGSISGSSIANVAATGTFTIPLMKKVGYKPHFAAAIEAVASTGGQIMPPVMGSTAFILAEILGISYSTIALKALIPALLYFLAVFVMVDLEAVKLHLKGMDRSELPDVKALLIHKWPLLLPIVVMLVMLLVMKTSPSKAALWSIAASVVAPLLVRIKVKGFDVLRALKEGAMSCIGIVAACATAGIVIAVLSLTGLGIKIGNLILGLAGGNVLLVLFFTMVVSIILGMGLPTPAAYVICVSVVGTAMSTAGIAPILAHMFVFYFSILAVITPPVALASYTAAGIAGANANKVGFTALKLGIVAFIVPYMFVLGPALLLEGTAAEIALSVVTAVAGVVFLGCGLQGWYRGLLPWWQRVMLVGAALTMIKPGLTTDLMGLGLFGAVTLLRLRLPGRQPETP